MLSGYQANSLEVKVSCYAGYRGEETPRSFAIGDREIGVGAIIDRWLGPDHRYFKLRGDDGDLYILRHDERSDRWELVMYQAGDSAGSTPGETQQEPESLH